MISATRIICKTIPLSFFNCLRLFLFVLCLSPGFLRFAWYYFISSDRVSVQYGNESVRQRLDVYRSSDASGVCRSNAPVLIFAPGGAWVIGYKMWGALLARALTATGIVVVIPDMRNYPLVSIPYMVEDIDLAIGWTIKNVADFGGDPRNVVVVG